MLKHITCLVDTMGTAYMLSSLLFPSAPGDRLERSLYKSKTRLKKKKSKKEKTTALKFWLPEYFTPGAVGTFKTAWVTLGLGFPHPARTPGLDPLFLRVNRGQLPSMQVPHSAECSIDSASVMDVDERCSEYNSTVLPKSHFAFLQTDTEMYGLSFWVETHIL